MRARPHVLCGPDGVEPASRVDARFVSTVDGPPPLSTTSSAGRNAELLDWIAPRRCSKNWPSREKEQQEAPGTRTADSCGFVVKMRTDWTLGRKEVD